MSLRRNHLDSAFFNAEAKLPFELRLKDFDMAMQDVYDFFYDVNRGLVSRGLLRLDDMLRPAIMSGLLSDMLDASLAKHSRTLTVNLFHNGHPDLIVNGVYPDNKVKSGRKEWKSRPRANQAEPSIRMEPVNNGCAFSCMR